MSEAEKRELQERIDLLCKGQASQYDRRCLLNYIEKLQKENQKLKEENIILEGNKIGYKLAIQEIKEKIENEIKELEENEDFYREHDRMYEYEGKINLLKRLLAKFE